MMEDLAIYSDTQYFQPCVQQEPVLSGMVLPRRRLMGKRLRRIFFGLRSFVQRQSVCDVSAAEILIHCCLSGQEIETPRNLISVGSGHPLHNGNLVCIRQSAEVAGLRD